MGSQIKVIKFSEKAKQNTESYKWSENIVTENADFANRRAVAEQIWGVYLPSRGASLPN